VERTVPQGGFRAVVGMRCLAEHDLTLGAGAGPAPELFEEEGTGRRETLGELGDGRGGRSAHRARTLVAAPALGGDLGVAGEIVDRADEKPADLGQAVVFEGTSGLGRGVARTDHYPAVAMELWAGIGRELVEAGDLRGQPADRFPRTAQDRLGEGRGLGGAGAESEEIAEAQGVGAETSHQGGGLDRPAQAPAHGTFDEAGQVALFVGGIFWSVVAHLEGALDGVERTVDVDLPESGPAGELEREHLRG